ncbi:MAG: hypothetical protein II902_03790 [Selenomonadaceae bacterium]|nr:hypothetical protein [Selenomonadaceae bacterium]
MKKFFQEKGQGVVEYALLLGLVAVIVVGITTDKDFWVEFHKVFEKVVDQITKYNVGFNIPAPVDPNSDWSP